MFCYINQTLTFTVALLMMQKLGSYQEKTNGQTRKCYSVENMSYLGREGQ